MSSWVDKGSAWTHRHVGRTGYAESEEGWARQMEDKNEVRGSAQVGWNRS